MILGNGKLNKPSLKVLRYRKGLAQGELAKLLDVKQATVSHIENFRMIPSPKLHKKICEVLDLSETFLIAYSDEQRKISKRKRKTNMIDDRLCMHYVVDRLEGCLNEGEDKIRKAIEDFREECIYNLGVNTRIKHKGED